MISLQLAARDLHAGNALKLATKPIPGLNRYLIENTEQRQRWGALIGEVSASHHWNLTQLHDRIGARGAVPTADGDILDAAYSACALRVIDYAHINHERARYLDRAVRIEVDREGATHWDAQANITGPRRENDTLAYGTTSPLESIEAWWLFHDMVVGLDSEIRSVHDYLQDRSISKGRFSLKGVKNVENPDRLSKLIPLADNRVPIDVRVQPNSMERLVELLGGPQLYGGDRWAPIRELIQNARDAIELRRAVNVDTAPDFGPKISLVLQETPEATRLTVSDNGIGMTKNVVIRHLIGVGSDFWNSSDFYQDFGKATDRGFKPIGKFGIGFLSVFMLGDKIEVRSERQGHRAVILSLRGLGKRGELRELPSTGVSGTSVTVILKPEVASKLQDLAAIARARAPMLDIPISVTTRHEKDETSENIPPRWWQTLPEGEFLKFVGRWESISHGWDTAEDDRDRFVPYSYTDDGFTSKFALSTWPARKPEAVDATRRVFSCAGDLRHGVIRCAQGIAVDRVPIDDVSGMIECGVMPLTAAREAISGDRYRYFRKQDLAGLQLRKDVTGSLRSAVLHELDQTEKHGLIPARLKFVRALTGIYGDGIATETVFPWIPVVVPPGNLIHHTPAALKDALGSQDRVLVSFGAGVGAAYALGSSLITQEELARSLAVAIPLEELSAGYELRDKLKQQGISNPLSGSLSKIRETMDNKLRAPILVRLCLTLVSEAWGRDIESLDEQLWSFDFESNVLTGLLRRI